MENILLVSRSAKNLDAIKDLLNTAFKGVKITERTSASEARQLMVVREFDLLLISTPLADENGEDLARDIAFRENTQVMMIVESENLDEVCGFVEDDGVLVVARPIDRNLFWSSLKLSYAMQRKLTKMRSENTKLKKKIEDIKIIDKAKWALVAKLNFSEQEAHKFIEKQAMNIRSSRREVANDILNDYGV